MSLAFGILIYDSLVLDLLGLIGVAERTECLFVVGGRDSGDHGCL